VSCDREVVCGINQVRCVLTCVPECLYTNVFINWWLSCVSGAKECLNAKKAELVSVVFAGSSVVFSCLQYSASYKMVCIMRRRQTGNFSLNCEQSSTDIGFHVLKTGFKVRGF
jgi:hypothetical protein